MQIDGISSIPPVSSIAQLQPVDGSASAATAFPNVKHNSNTSTVAAGSSSASTSTQADASSGNSATAKNASSGRGAARGASSGGASSTASDTSQLIAAVYSTTVNGKTYTGSVEESNGEYVASAPGLPGASASGASVASAEAALGLIISVLA